MNNIKDYISYYEKISSLDDYIQEKLIINKHIQLNSIDNIKDINTSEELIDALKILIDSLDEDLYKEYEKLDKQKNKEHAQFYYKTFNELYNYLADSIYDDTFKQLLAANNLIRILILIGVLKEDSDIYVRYMSSDDLDDKLIIELRKYIRNKK